MCPVWRTNYCFQTFNYKHHKLRNKRNITAYSEYLELFVCYIAIEGKQMFPLFEQHNRNILFFLQISATTYQNCRRIRPESKEIDTQLHLQNITQNLWNQSKLNFRFSWQFDDVMMSGLRTLNIALYLQLILYHENITTKILNMDFQIYDQLNRACFYHIFTYFTYGSTRGFHV